MVIYYDTRSGLALVGLDEKAIWWIADGLMLVKMVVWVM
jgi:hypothetical protein